MQEALLQQTLADIKAKKSGTLSPQEQVGFYKKFGEAYNQLDADRQRQLLDLAGGTGSTYMGLAKDKQGILDDSYRARKQVDTASDIEKLNKAYEQRKGLIEVPVGLERELAGMEFGPGGALDRLIAFAERANKMAYDQRNTVSAPQVLAAVGKVAAPALSALLA